MENNYRNIHSIIYDNINSNKYNIEELRVNGPVVAGKIKNNEKGILALNIPYKSG